MSNKSQHIFYRHFEQLTERQAEALRLLGDDAGFRHARNDIGLDEKHTIVADDVIDVRGVALDREMMIGPDALGVQALLESDGGR